MIHCGTMGVERNDLACRCRYSGSYHSRRSVILSGLLFGTPVFILRFLRIVIFFISKKFAPSARFPPNYIQEFPTIVGFASNSSAAGENFDIWAIFSHDFDKMCKYIIKSRKFQLPDCNIFIFQILDCNKYYNYYN